VGINRNELTAGFKAQFGLTPNAFSVSLRMKEARALLDSGKLSISEIARHVGYSSYASFAHAFRAYYGEAPAVKR